MKRISSSMIIAILVPVVIFGGIGLSMNLGWWRTGGGRGAPTMLNRSMAMLNQAQAGGLGSSGELSGPGGQLYDPGSIRGNSTFAEIEYYFGVSAELIAQAFGIEAANPGKITAKFVDGLYGEMKSLDGEDIDIGTDGVKFFISLMTGIPYEKEDDTGIPESAIDVVLALGPGLTEEQRQEMFRVSGESRTIRFEDANFDLTGSAGGQEDNQPSTPQPASSSEPFVWQGRTSFADVMLRGVTQAQIENVLGIPIGSRTQSVREFTDKNGLQYNRVRTALSALIDNAQ